MDPAAGGGAGLAVRGLERGEVTELENLRFLAGYRRPWLFDAASLDQIRGADVGGRTFGEVVLGLADCDPAAARAAVLHLLWLGELKTDLSTPLSDRHEIVRSA